MLTLNRNTFLLQSKCIVLSQNFRGLNVFGMYHKVSSFVQVVYSSALGPHDAILLLNGPFFIQDEDSIYFFTVESASILQKKDVLLVTAKLKRIIGRQSKSKREVKWHIKACFIRSEHSWRIFQSLPTNVKSSL